MELKEMFKKLQSGEVTAHSELGTRDESKQNRNFGSRIQKMKTVTGINARVLVMKDVVLKFNPFTGVADENYNPKTPFRPILLVSQVLELINSVCAENPAAKEFWEKDLGITIPAGEPTMDEYMAFKSKGYIKPRVMSYSTVAMNFGGTMGFPEFKVKYSVDPTELNEEGTYDYDKAPVWHQAAIFFQGMLKPEADARTEALQKKGQNKETIANERSAVFSKSPVSFVRPTNLIPFLFFPLSEAPRTFDLQHPQELEQAMRYYGFTDKWLVPLKEAMEQPMFDEVMDFYDFTVKTPSSNDLKPNGQVYTDEDSMELYTAMQITNTDGRLSILGGQTKVGNEMKPNSEVFANVLAAAKAYFVYSQEQSSTEGGDTFEKIMAASNRFRPITTAMPNFLAACNEVFNASFATSPYCTEEFLKANHQFYTALNPQNALAMAAEDEEDLEAARQQQRASVADMISEVAPKTSQEMEALGIGGSAIDDMDLE